MISIQPFTIENKEVTLDIIHTTVKTCYPEFYSPEVIDFFIEYHNEESLLKRHQSGEVYNLLYKSSIVGTGFLVEEELGGLYVLPEFQNKSLGAHMLHFLLDRARKKKLHKVWLDATPNSKRFYLNNGFTLQKEETMFVDDKYPLLYYIMEYYFTIH